MNRYLLLALVACALAPMASRARAAEMCELFPIALSSECIAGATIGSTLPDVLNGTQPGNFGWLTWAGSPSVLTLIQSLRPPGDSGTYIHPENPQDHQVSVGDWVRGKPGVSNARNIRDALDVLKQIDVTVPIWDQTRGQGAAAEYQVSGFARIRLLSYQLAGQNRITVHYLGPIVCGLHNQPPRVDAGPDQTNALPATVTLNGIVTDDGLPAGGSFSVLWSFVSGPGTVTFSNPAGTNTSAAFPSAGIYVLRLTASDSELSANDDVTVTVNRENHLPVAFAQTVTNLEDTVATIALTGFDEDGDALEFIVVALPSHGTLAGTPPNLQYTPVADYNGQDSLSFKVRDGFLESATATIAITNLPANDPPVADEAEVSTIEDTAATFSFSGADVDGDPLTVSIIQPPAHGTLTVTPTNAIYSPATNYHGDDSFIYMVNDGLANSSQALVVITIASANDIPLVDAGPDQLISLPLHSTPLIGLVSDDDFGGASLLLQWSFVTGPGAVSFTDSGTNAGTLATFETNGIYSLRLTADDGFLFDFDDVVVTVNAPPLVNAGSNQLVNLPLEAVLNGAVTDDGFPINQLGVTWSASGPGTVIFSNPTSTNSTAAFSAGGLYTLRLVADDTAARSTNEIMVLANRAPTVDAGSTQTIATLATTLAASVNDDGFPSNTLALTWTKVSGPGGVMFATNAESTSVTFSSNGTYVLRLTADDSAAQTSSDVTIHVNAAPSVSAGPDQFTALPFVAELTASFADDGLPPGAPTSTLWSLVSGPDAVAFDDPTRADAIVSFESPGIYTLRFTVSDSMFATFDDVVVTVDPQNQPPLVHAGQNQFVILPDSVALSGAVADDGFPRDGLLTFSWNKLMGPPGETIGNVLATNTPISFTTAGNYIFRLTATDGEFTVHSDVTFVVKSEGMNAAPVVNAGADQTIGLTNQLTLNAFADDDGLPRHSTLSVAWSKVSGPGNVAFASAASASTTATFDQLGSYVLRLTANDSLLSAADEVAITVYPHNQPPVVDAGADQTITIPDPAALANGSNSASFLSQSLLTVDAWNPSISQPGLSEIPSWIITLSPNVPRYGTTYAGTNLYVCGYFYNAGGQTVWTLARWDGTHWNPVRDIVPTSIPGGLGYEGFVVLDFNSGVLGVAARSNEIFALTRRARDFNLDGGLDSGARWTGSNWMAWTPQIFANFGGVTALAAFDDAAYRGGFFDFQPTNSINTDRFPAPVPGLPISHGIAKYVGTNWEMMGDGISGEVAAIAKGKQGEIYAAGSFMNNVANGVAHNIAKWNGTNWTRLGAGLTRADGAKTLVLALAVAANGDLYAGGNFNLAGGLPANFIARWDGTSWSPLGSGANNGVGPVGVQALAVEGNNLYVGGGFTSAGGFSARGVAKWNGHFWSTLGSGSSNGVIGTVNSFAVAPTGVYIGGDFKAGTANATNIVLWEHARPPARGVLLEGRVSDDGLPPSSILSVTWSKASGPGNVTFENNASAVTTATFDQLGTYVLRLTAHDSELTALDEVTIVVQANQPPAVNAGIDQVIDLTATTFLDGTVTDDGSPPGADVPHVWSVVTGPGSATFGNAQSTNSNVRFSTAGSYLLRLTANDSHFTSFDDVVITVRATDNQRPNAVARTLPETVAVGQLTTLTAHDLRDDGRPFGVTNVLWSQVSGPAPMRFFSPTAAVCQAMVTMPGTYVVRVDVNDGELNFTSEYHLNGIAGTPPAPDGNQPPGVSAGADFSAVAFQNTPLHGILSDDGLPQGAVFTAWSKVSGPANVYFANAAAAGTTVKFYVPGSYVLRLAANDGRVSVTDEVTVTVSAPTNEPPFVVTGPDLQVIRPAPALLEAAFFDDALPGAGGKTFSWSTVSGPGAVTFNPITGNVSNDFVTSSATFSSTGVYVLRVTVSDSLLTDSDTVTVTVLPGTNSPPFVNAGPDQNVALSDPTILSTEVLDDGLEDGILDIRWSKLSGPGGAAFSTLNGTYRVSFDTPGTYVLRLTATDYVLTNYDDVIITVYDAPNAPEVALFSPGEGQSLTFPSNITGTASSPLLTSFALRYRLATSEEDLNPNPWIVFATGNVSVVNGTLGQLDPTLLLNGTYEIELAATDLIGQTSTTNIFVVVERNMKVGHFTLSFNDLTIPVAGIPIQVVRTYDSRDKRTNDFGVGWTLQLKDVRLQKNRHLGKAWDQTSTGGLLPTYFIDTLKPRFVTITFPDNRVYKFQAVLSPNAQAFVPLIYPNMAYVPLGNTRGSLTPIFLAGGTERVVDDQLVWSGDVPGRADFMSWELLLDPPPGAADNILYNPDLFEFKSQEGYTYLISETNGLRSMTDPNGNTLLITTNGLLWTNAANSSTLAVQFQRDALGRITNIIDALGQSLNYSYDSNGNLASFIDRAGNTNLFTYSVEHQLLTFTDGVGNQVLSNSFDGSGRLVQQQDATGHSLFYTHDLANRSEHMTNRLGHATTREYDERGNLVRTTDPLGAVSTFTYDANDNVIAASNAACACVTSFEYDSSDNLVLERDAAGNTKHYTHNSLGQVLTFTDPEGVSTTNRYDNTGNLIAITDAQGLTTAFGYNRQGKVSAVTNAQGGKVLFTYNEFGHLTNEVDELGNVTSYTVDANGRLLSQTRTRRVRIASGAKALTRPQSTSRAKHHIEREPLISDQEFYYTNTVVQFVHDPNGRLRATLLPEDIYPMVHYDQEYNGNGQPIVSAGPNGTTTTAYGADGRVASITHPDGSVETFTYDAEGQLTCHTTARGATCFEWDARGKLGCVTFPDSSKICAEYDQAGRLIRETDQNNCSLTYEYDAVGNRTAVTDPFGNKTHYAFSARRACTNVIDALNRVTSLEFDYLNRHTKITFPDGTSHSATYLGRLVKSVTDEAGRTMQRDYDEQGRVISVLDPAERETRFQYDEIGNLLAVLEPGGRFTVHDYNQLNQRIRTEISDKGAQTFLHDSASRVVAITNAIGGVTHLAYDRAGRVTNIVDPENLTTDFGYDPKGDLALIRNGNGEITQYETDVMGRRLRTTFPDGTSEANTFDAAGLLKSHRDRAGFTTTYTYDCLSRPATMRDPASQLTTFAYDAGGRMTNLTFEGRSTGYRYDLRDRVTDITRFDGATEHFTYDVLGRLAASTDAGGRTLSYFYDSANRMTNITGPLGFNRSFSFNAAGFMASVTDSISGRTDYSYDSMGNVTRVQFSNGTFTQSAYDALGRRTTFTDARGHTTGFAYDGDSRLVGITNALGEVTSYSYDAAHRLIAIVDALQRRTEFIYDVEQRQRVTLFADNSATTNIFDPRGLLVSATDEEGRTTQFGYDSLGQLTNVLNALGKASNSLSPHGISPLTMDPAGEGGLGGEGQISTSYEYDPLGRLARQTDALGRTNAFHYDDSARTVVHTIQDGLSERMAFDPLGNVLERTDFNGFKTIYHYDAQHRLESILPDERLTNSAAISFTYDELGRRTSMIDGSGVTTYEYDAQSRLLRKTAPQGILDYTYDNNGNVTSVASGNANGASLTYEYDALNRLSAVNDPRLGNSSYTYDAVGNFATQTKPNGVLCTYQYDVRNRLKQVSHGTIASYQYSLDRVGNRIASTETLAPAARTIERLHTYDALDRMRAESISVNGAPAVIDYSYDDVGNRLSRTSTLAALSSIVDAFDANDRLGRDAFDANGNTLTATNANRAAGIIEPVFDDYDFQDRLVRRTTTFNSQPATLGFVHDGDGNRVRKIATAGGSSFTTHYLIDELNPTGWPQVLEELTSVNGGAATVTRVNTWGHGLIGQDQFDGNAWQRRVTGMDAMGNVRFLTDPGGNVTDSFDYDGFGNLIARSGTPATHLYRGEQFDADLGLYHLRARYYNPDSGRFWTRDSFSGMLDDPQSQHRYAYAQNNPVNRIDPSGHFSLTETLLVTGLLPDVRDAMDSLWSGINSFTHGLGGGEIMKAKNHASGLFVQGLVPETGVYLGRANFFNTIQGAPFLLSLNPYIYIPEYDCFSCQKVGFGAYGAFFGSAARYPMFQFDFESSPLWGTAEFLGYAGVATATAAVAVPALAGLAVVPQLAGGLAYGLVGSEALAATVTSGVTVALDVTTAVEVGGGIYEQITHHDWWSGEQLSDQEVADGTLPLLLNAIPFAPRLLGPLGKVARLGRAASSVTAHRALDAARSLTRSEQALWSAERGSRNCLEGAGIGSLGAKGRSTIGEELRFVRRSPAEPGSHVFEAPVQSGRAVQFTDRRVNGPWGDNLADGARTLPPGEYQTSLNLEGQIVFSGHGTYEFGNGGLIRVPEGTSLRVRSRIGEPIYDRLGNAIELRADLSRIGSKVYRAGDLVPNYFLHPGPDLQIISKPWVVTVDIPTRLSSLLKPNMGEVQWAACQAIMIRPAPYLP